MSKLCREFVGELSESAVREMAAIFVDNTISDGHDGRCSGGGPPGTKEETWGPHKIENVLESQSAVNKSELSPKECWPVHKD